MMAQRDLLIQPVSSPGCQSLFSPPPLTPSPGITERFQELPKLCSPRHFCLPSKAVLIIFLWSAVVGAIFAAVFDAMIGIAVNRQHVIKHHNADVLIWYVIVPYAILMLVLLLYPVSGFLADIYCGRYKTITFSIFLLWCAFVPLSVISVLIYLELNTTKGHDKAIYVPLGGIVFILIVIALAGYQANIIQLGLDQLLEAPCRYLGLFVHWNGWSTAFGAFFSHIVAVTYACYSDEHGIALKFVESIPLVFLLILSVLLAFSCYNHRWFYSEPGQHNPYRTVFKVLSFAKKHKHPIRRSALTYCDDERPSRIDFAKRKFGGPFETDQVEDVKTFLRILCLLLSLGPVFVLEVPTSHFAFVVFGLHISVGKEVEFKDSKKCQSFPRWLLLESGCLKELLTIVALPLYIWIVYSVLYRKVPRILSRLKLGVVLFLVGTLSMLVIDLSGHIMSRHGSTTNSSHAHCMFIAETKHYDFAPLNMTHWVLIPPNVILGIAPILVNITVFEFISAQSPHSMKGLLIGMFFAIKGFFQFLGAMSLIPFGLPSLWDTQKLKTITTNCGFFFFLFTSAIGLVGFILFLITAHYYRYRQRDEAPYDHRYVESYYKRYARPSHVQQSPLCEERVPIRRGPLGEPRGNNYGAVCGVAHIDNCSDPSLSSDWS